jgi:hypothetical protein
MTGAHARGEFLGAGNQSDKTLLALGECSLQLPAHDDVTHSTDRSEGQNVDDVVGDIGAAHSVPHLFTRPVTMTKDRKWTADLFITKVAAPCKFRYASKPAGADWKPRYGTKTHQNF